MEYLADRGGHQEPQAFGVIDVSDEPRRLHVVEELSRVRFAAQVTKRRPYSNT